MERCEHLERICEKIRKGELVSFLEAIAAINYQEQLKAEREAGRWYMRLWRRLRSNAVYTTTDKPGPAAQGDA